MLRWTGWIGTRGRGDLFFTAVVVAGDSQVDLYFVFMFFGVDGCRCLGVFVLVIFPIAVFTLCDTVNYAKVLFPFCTSGFMVRVGF